MNNDEQRDHLDEEQREAGLAVAAVMGAFAMHQHRAFFAGEPFVPSVPVGGFLRNVTFSGDLYAETGGRIPFAEMVLADPPYVDPAELPDWVNGCPFTVVQSVQFFDDDEDEEWATDDDGTAVCDERCEPGCGGH